MCADYYGPSLHQKISSSSFNLPPSAIQLITPEGEIVQNYHKLHLLDVNYGNDGPIRESKTTLKGEKLLEPHQTPVGKRT